MNTEGEAEYTQCSRHRRSCRHADDGLQWSKERKEGTTSVGVNSPRSQDAQEAIYLQFAAVLIRLLQGRSQGLTVCCWKSDRCALQLLSSRTLGERSSWWMMGGSALCRKLKPATTCLSIDTIISLSSITCCTQKHVH